jgi:hypothetical protein
LQAFIAPNPVSLSPELLVVTISIFMMALVDQRRSSMAKYRAQSNCSAMYENIRTEMSLLSFATEKSARGATAKSARLGSAPLEEGQVCLT